MTNQPTPSVSDADVERVVKRDFPADARAEVFSILHEYGVEEWQREPVRVRLAVLKLANGSMERLRLEIKGAKSDYRDVLAPAEYPSYMQRYGKNLSMEEKKRIIDADWRQYQEWLAR